MKPQLRSSLLPSSVHELVRSLAERVRQCETSRRKPTTQVVSTGFAELDRLLPDGGLRRGMLVEWLAAEPGGGATSLALAAARQACGEEGMLVVVDRGPGAPGFYPLAAAAFGIDLKRVLVVRPENDRDETWALDQSLRSRGISAVLAWPERLSDHLFRRLQLAAEQGNTLGLLVRPAKAQAEPSWAELRMMVSPRPSTPEENGAASRDIELTLLRCPGQVMIRTARLSIEPEPQRAQRRMGATKTTKTAKMN